MEQNSDMKTRAEDLESRVQEAHDRYVKSKGKPESVKKNKRSTSDRFNFHDNNAYKSGKVSVYSGGRNASLGATSKKGGGDGNRSHSSSYTLLHMTKDLESIYKEFEAGEVNELNKLRRLVSHFRGLSRRTQVQFHDLKSSTTKEIAYLKDQYS